MAEPINFSIHDDVSIVISGQAGQGINTVERIFTGILKRDGYNIFATKEYMSRVRGGSNSTSIRVSSKPVSASLERIDILIPLDKDLTNHLKKRISKETLIISDKNIEIEHDLVMHLPFIDMALKAGGKILANTLIVSFLLGLLKAKLSTAEDYLKSFFNRKGQELVDKNLLALHNGYSLAQEYSERDSIIIEVLHSEGVRDDLLLSGTDAVSLGCVAGGCNFISSYPMSPSTGLLTFLSQHSRDLGIIAEQTEDEISAINMAIGAWYAGARGVVTTSGGGFALMIEGLSLSGMLETPIVIHLSQRPAPATGLPTRTEQGDLEFALYSGHGDFPRIILAPGTLEEGFYLSQQAFNLADKYQVPVFILTDQYFVDTYYNIPEQSIDLNAIRNEYHIVKTDIDYKRYLLTENGISPRGIPLYGNGLVSVDSDEHNEEGHLTEDLDLREKMVEKRLRKFKEIEKDIIPPILIGDKDYDYLIISWGSSQNTIREALERLSDKNIALLHFSQVYPLHPSVRDYLNKAKKIILIENNATGQLGNLIYRTFGVEIKQKILKSNGLAFYVEEIVRRISEII